ncbi:hypothetical protein LINPERHAP2_LOCUS26368 [Linum perenne]
MKSSNTSGGNLICNEKYEKVYRFVYERTWILGLEKHSKKLWFVSGLGDFFRYYSISRGQIILFKYCDSNRLKVFICSSSSMEINYPANPPEPEIEYPDSEVCKKLDSSPIIVSTRFVSIFWKTSTATKMAIGRAVDSNPRNLSAMVIMAKYNYTSGVAKNTTTHLHIWITKKNSIFSTY